VNGIETTRHANTGIGLTSFRSNAATAVTPKTPWKRIAFSIVLPPLLPLLRCCGIVCAGGARWHIRFGAGLGGRVCRDGYTKVGQRLGGTGKAVVCARFVMAVGSAWDRGVRVRQEFGVWRWTESRLKVHRFNGSLGLRLAHTGAWPCVCVSGSRDVAFGREWSCGPLIGL